MIESIVTQNVSKKTLVPKPLLKGGFPGGISGKEPANKAGDIRDMDSMPGSGRFPGREGGDPLQYSSVFLPGESHGQRSLGGGKAIVHRVAKSWT